MEMASFKKAFYILIIGITFTVQFNLCYCQCKKKFHSATILKAMTSTQMKDPHFVVDGVSLLSKEYKAEILKCFSDHHHFSKFLYNFELQGNENRINQPLVMWNQYATSKIQSRNKVLIVLDMANDREKIVSHINIGQEIYFLNLNNTQLYEIYSINRKQVTNYLASSTWNETESLYLDNTEVKEIFEKRRNNFHRIELKGMVEIYAPNVVLPQDFPKTAKYFPSNETYDVTNLVTGTYIELLHLMEIKLNFTTKLYLRKDRVWGVPKQFPNGTIEYPGMIGNIIDESADFIWATIVRNVERNPYLEFLPTLNTFHGVIYLPKLQETSDWIVYFAPFTESLWIGITISGTIMAMSLCFIETVHCKKFVSCHVMSIMNSLIYFTFLVFFRNFHPCSVLFGGLSIQTLDLFYLFQGWIDSCHIKG